MTDGHGIVIMEGPDDVGVIREGRRIEARQPVDAPERPPVSTSVSVGAASRAASRSAAS